MKHQDLQKRLITAIFFVLIILSAIILDKYAFIVLFGVICTISLFEFHTLLYYDLTGKKKSKRILANVLIGFIPYLAVATYYVGSDWFDMGRLYAAGILLFLCISVYYMVELASTLPKPFIIVAYALTGVFYITIPCVMVLAVSHYSGEFDYRCILGILLLNWSNDTGAYLIGSQIGKHKLFPRISPKKTWEGFIGGAITTIVVGLILGNYLGNMPTKDWFILALIVVVFGTIGDLIESMFKRSLEAKDSGRLLPGHGGFLDRFDSFFFVVPFAAFYIMFVR
jgi:phosphatidate cytidylyltransferase